MKCSPSTPRRLSLGNSTSEPTTTLLFTPLFISLYPGSCASSTCSLRLYVSSPPVQALLLTESVGAHARLPFPPYATRHNHPDRVILRTKIEHECRSTTVGRMFVD
jgi:hypothetical protein